MSESYWRKTRLGRRSLMAVGGAALTVAACGTSDKKLTTARVPGQPKRGATLRYVNNDVGPLDPATGRPSPLQSTVYEWLAVWKQTAQKAIPHLALGWEQPDASTIVFRLDPSAHWQDKAPLSGRRLTSQDAQYTFNYYNSPGPRFQFKSDLAGLNLSRTETPDNATVVLHLDRPFLPQLTTLLTSNKLFILPREVVERDGSLDKEAIGSGPFLVDQYVQNGAVNLVRNATYWKPGLPYLDEVQILPIKDVAAQLSAFSSANIDLLERLSFDQQKDLPKSAQVVRGPTWSWQGLRFNVTRKPFDDVRVRRALHLAIDRDAINQIVYAGNSAPSAAISPVYGKFALPNEELQQQPGYRKPKDQDLADAKKLLEAAGVRDLSVTIVGGNQGAYASLPPVALVDQLAKIGVKVTPDIQDFANYGRTRQTSDFALVSDSQPGTGDPDSILRAHYYTGAGQNYGRYSNPQLDALIDKQAEEPDVEKRTQILHDIQRLLLGEMPLANYFYNVAITALQPYVRGVGEWVGPSLFAPYYGFGQTAWLDK